MAEEEEVAGARTSLPWYSSPLRRRGREEGGRREGEEGEGRREDGKGKNYPLLHVLEVSRWCHYSQLVRAKPARA